MAAEGRELIEVVRLSTGYLGSHGSDSPRLDAELLAAHGLGLRRLDVYLQFDRRLTDTELTRVRDLLRRRGKGEPIAHITGEKEFHSRSFRVSGDVLIPRPDTESLVERALVAARSIGPAPRIADLGTGSGCIAVTIAAEIPGASVVAIDLSSEAASVASANARAHGVADRVDVRVGDWAHDLEVMDIVVSNPPYGTSAELAELERDVADYEPPLAIDGGSDGLLCYRALMASLVATPSWLGVEVDPRRADAVAGLLGSRWPGSEVTITTDLTGRSRVVEVTPAPGPG
ncbi:MAG: peptide chain release factor N(5)-glutamine methyltransferase [Candidatus Dormibacteria bacterium]